MTRYLVLGLAGIGLTGCIIVSRNEHSVTPPPQVVYVPVVATTQVAVVSTDFAARIRAAETITSFVERDAALGQIAQDAASCGDAVTTRQALQGMTQFTARDRACETACLALAQRGHRAEAIELAQTMTQFTRRDETLRRLAAN